MNKSASLEVGKNHLISKIIIKMVAVLLISMAVFAIMFAAKNGNFIVDDGHSYVPENGFVPDEETAKKIAELIARKIYGDARIDGQKPFKTKLKGGVWVVSGTISSNFLGGTFEVHLSKVDGKIIRVTHGK